LRLIDGLIAILAWPVDRAVLFDRDAERRQPLGAYVTKCRMCGVGDLAAKCVEPEDGHNNHIRV